MGDDYVDLYGDLDEIHENEELEAVSVTIRPYNPTSSSNAFMHSCTRFR